MSNFITHVELGFKHVLDFNGYDHILFLIVLAVIFLVLVSGKRFY